MAVPMPRSEQDLLFVDDTAEGPVLVVVSDPNRKPRPPAERMATLFELTPAEARMAATLATGVSINDYAAQNELSLNTARWTLKQIQSKMDCRRQSEMMRIFSALAVIASQSDDAESP